MASQHPSRIFLLFLLVIVLVVVLAEIFSNFKVNPGFTETDALVFSQECANQTELTFALCLNVKIVNHVDQIPADTGKIFATFWQLAKAGKLSYDPRVFSDITHNAGMVLIEKGIPLDQAFSFCGTDFKQGCIHGATMEYIDNQYRHQVDAPTLVALCQKISGNNNLFYLNCLHAVGHELAAKSISPIPQVLHLCDPLKGEQQSACVSGALMEYSKGTAGSGSHSDLPTGKLELPCATVDEMYKSVCYASAGSYRQFEPRSEDFSESFQEGLDFCFGVPTKYVENCLLGVADRAMIATAENQQKLKAICQSLNNKEREAECNRAMAAIRKIYYQ